MEKIIHQIWFQGNRELPKKYQEKTESWQTVNQDYIHILWDEKMLNDFIYQYYPNFYKLWVTIDKFIKKCDAARYLLLYHFGGIYADVDTEAYKPIDLLISSLNLCNVDIIFSEECHLDLCWKSELKKMVASEQKLDIIVGNAVLISKKKQKFWMDFLESCFKRKHMPVLESFSTWHLTEYLHYCQTDSVIKILPNKYLLSIDFQSKYSFVTHDYDASWFNKQNSKPWEG